MIGFIIVAGILALIAIALMIIDKKQKKRSHN